MITCSQDYQTKYDKLYEKMRSYTWDMYTVEQLANLEVEVYNAFVNKSEVMKHINKLRCTINKVSEDYNDDGLKESLDQLENVASNDDSSFLRLYKIQEVLK